MNISDDKKEIREKIYKWALENANGWEEYAEIIGDADMKNVYNEVRMLNNKKLNVLR